MPDDTEEFCRRFVAAVDNPMTFAIADGAREYYHHRLFLQALGPEMTELSFIRLYDEKE